MSIKALGLVAGIAAAGGQTHAQDNPNLGAAHRIAPTMRAAEPAGHTQVRQPIVASLTYDGIGTIGAAGQDFESAFDLYDVFICEPFGLTNDANLTEFRSVGFGTGNPFGATDFVARIYNAASLADICDDGVLPDPLLVSIPGLGFWDADAAVTDFGGQCLPKGDYIIGWAAEMDFLSFGQVFFFTQNGQHDNGLGSPNDAFQSNPGNGFGMGNCFPVRGQGDLSTGVNFILCGDAADCSNACPDPTGCGDWDADGDSDADDFFAYLDSFTSGDPCADITANGSTDAEDFFAFLDAFVQPC